MTEWDTLKTDQLEKRILSLWLDELLKAERSGRKTKSKRLQDLTQDIAHLKGCEVSIVINQLVTSLWSNDDEVRGVAAESLKELGDRVPIEPLLQALQDKDQDVREAEVEFL